MITQNNKFCPTPSEDKLLVELVNPNNFGDSITDICNKAVVSRNVFYDMRVKEGFWDFYIKLKMDMIKDKVGDLYDATFNFATKNAKNHSDRKLLFEMLKLYKDESTLNIKKDNNLGDMSEAEIEQELAKLKEEESKNE